MDNSPSVVLARHPSIKWLLRKLGVIKDIHYKTEWPRNIIRYDCRRRLPFRTSKVEYIYHSHLLEHLSLEDARRFNKECWRVLRPGGILRVVVPELSFMARNYLTRHGENDPEAAGNFIDLLVQHDARSYHRWMYDFSSLRRELSLAGFENVVRQSIGQGNMPDLDKVDRPEHSAQSLYVEAMKLD